MVKQITPPNVPVIRFAELNPHTMVVENVIRAPQGFVKDGVVLVASEVANIGDTYQYGLFVPPFQPEESQA